MKTAKVIKGRKCPVCGKADEQILSGKTAAGSQRCFCKSCKKYYTLNPKTREIPDEKKLDAIRMFFLGVSARKVGQFFGFSKANVLNWLKKTSAADQRRENIPAR